MKVKSLKFIELEDFCNFIQKVDAEFNIDKMNEALEQIEIYRGDFGSCLLDLYTILDTVENWYSNEFCLSCQGVGGDECDTCNGTGTQFHVYSRIRNMLDEANLDLNIQVRL